MKERILSLLGIEPGEESMIITLLTQSVFLGIFFGSFDISAHSLFLSIFDEKKMAQAYVISGLTGIILTTLYTQVQNRMKFKNFSVINLAFVTVLTLILWIFLVIYPEKWVIFLVFVLLGPLNILAMLGFWGTVSRLFTIRQGKRLFSLVDAGLVVGMIVSCYSIPVLLSFGFATHNILLISAGGVIIATFLQFSTGSKYLTKQETSGGDTSAAVSKKSIIGLIRENSYVRLLAIFIALSVMAAFFVQYSFMAVTREQYPAEADMARFLGLFTGSMMIFTLLIKLAAFAYVIRNYGLRTCLSISPVVILGLTIAAFLIGTLLGFTPLTGGFLLFFLIMALSRLFSKSLKDSIESPSFKVIYLTFDEKTRYSVQSGMDGTINEIAALSSGLLLSLLGIMASVKLIHFSAVLLLISGAWVFVAFKVYSGYRNSIRRALEAENVQVQEADSSEETRISLLPYNSGGIFDENYFQLVTGDYSVLKKYPGNGLILKILEHAGSENDLTLLPLLKQLSVSAELPATMREKARMISGKLETLSSSVNEKDDRIGFARKLLLEARQPQTTQILRLLRDNSTVSRSLALILIGKFRLSDMIQEVCEGLDNPKLRITAFQVLKSFGPEAADKLQRYFISSSGNIETGRSILRLLASEGSDNSKLFLFSRLWSNSRLIKEEALDLLLRNNFKCPEDERDHIHQLISDVIGIITWNLSARISVENNSDRSLLVPLNEETARWNQFLFGLLSITYDSPSVSRIKENLESGTVGSVNYALEMIDMVIEESIKPKIIALLDAVPDETRVKNLYHFYPGVIPDYSLLLDLILNRDYNLLGTWIRAVALRSISSAGNEPLSESVIALLFSPEIILKEEAARLIARSGRDIFDSVSGRIPESLREKIVDFSLKNDPSAGDLFEKTHFLKRIFTGINEDTLMYLSSRMVCTENTDKRSLPVTNGFVIWNRETPESPKIFPDGQSDLHKAPEVNAGGSYLLPLTAVEEFYYQNPEKSSAIKKHLAEIKN
jgi:ATP:ADP antiporter, AAA family